MALPGELFGPVGGFFLSPYASSKSNTPNLREKNNTKPNWPADFQGFHSRFFRLVVAANWLARRICTASR
jgi:hypothetical protein